jgi:hypothetical protein
MQCFSIAPIACVIGCRFFDLPDLFGLCDWLRLFDENSYNAREEAVTLITLSRMRKKL